MRERVTQKRCTQIGLVVGEAGAGELALVERLGEIVKLGRCVAGNRCGAISASTGVKPAVVGFGQITLRNDGLIGVQQTAAGADADNCVVTGSCIPGGKVEAALSVERILLDRVGECGQPGTNRPRRQLGGSADGRARPSRRLIGLKAAAMRQKRGGLGEISYL